MSAKNILQELFTETSEDRANAEKQRERRARKIRYFGERYKEASLATVQLSGSDADIAFRFIKRRKNFLIFTGNAGIGKTYFAAAAFDYAQSIHNTCRYWKELDLLKAIRSQMSMGNGDYLETLEYLIDDDFVIIDDVGSSGLNDWRKEVLFAAIDYRYNSMKPTILISNFSPQDFKEFFHERLASRLFSKENFVINIQDGDDLRGQGL